MTTDKEHRTRLIRLREILAPAGPIPVSKSTWWAGVKSGRFPKPIKLGPKISVWRAEDIAQIVANSPAHTEGEGDD